MFLRKTIWTLFVPVLAVFCSALSVVTVDAQDFAKDDYVVLLIRSQTQHRQRTVEQEYYWRMDSQASLFKATEESNLGKLIFSRVAFAQEVPCERICGVNIRQPNFYGHDGFVPPGIYFLSYLGSDSSSGETLHALALGDGRQEPVIQVPGGAEPVVRMGLQIHAVKKGLQYVTPEFSKGCVVLNPHNFSKLFPPAFLAPETSPLSDCGRAGFRHNGAGNVLVFITNLATEYAEKKQLKIFDDILLGKQRGLRKDDFQDTSVRLRVLRDSWYAAY